MSNLNSLRNNVTIKPIIAEDLVTTSGIIIPEVAKSKANEKESVNWGIVHSVGPNVEDIIVGDKVFYNKYSGRKVEYGGETYIQINANEVFGFVNR